MDDVNVSLQAEFFLNPVKLEFASLQQGRAIFEDRVFIKKWVPGDRTVTIVREVTAEDRAEFPNQWAAFQNQTEQMQSGTPISMWEDVPLSQRAELSAAGFKTIESLAVASDTQCQGLGAAGMSLRERAKRYVGQEEKRGPGRPRKEAEAA